MVFSTFAFTYPTWENIDSMKKFLGIIVFFLLPLFANAQTFQQLWNKVGEAAKKDLPQTQLDIIRQIEKKAVKEKQYGQLLKAQLRHGILQTNITPDSVDAHVKRIEHQYNQFSDPAPKAIYATAIGKMYETLGSDSDEIVREKWFGKAMAYPSVLASQKSDGYEPALVKGADSKIFNNDLLHVIALETNRYTAAQTYYQQHDNRDAACYMAMLVVNYNMNNWGDSVCAAKLDSLLRVYQDLPVACELAIAKLRTMNENDAEAKVKFIEQALAKWGTWKRASYLRNQHKLLEQPTYSINIGKTVLPNSDFRLNITSIRNVAKLNVSIFKVAIDGNTHLDPSVDSDYNKLKKCIAPSPVATYERNYDGLPAWKLTSDSIKLSGLPVGVYMIEVSTDNKNIKVSRRLLRVTDVFVIHQTLPDHKIRLAVVSATTGKPLADAKIVITNYQVSGKPTADKQTITADKNGEAVCSYKNMPRHIYTYTPNDKSSAEYDLFAYFNYYQSSGQPHRIAVYTDRSIYRPGQNVHVAAIAWEANKEDLTSKVAPNTLLTFSLMDANYKKVAEKKATTDDFGTACADFSLPQHGLTGGYHVEVKTANSDRSATANFHVEEYKRPLFQVVFDKFASNYHAGDTVTLRAVATTYSGVPVQNANVKYTVNRRNGLRWHSWGSMDKTLILSDSTITGKDGSFKVRVPMSFPENSHIHGATFFDYDVNAIVTDMSGETHEAQTSLPLSNRNAILTSNLPDKALSDSLNNVIFGYKNLWGEEVDAIVRYRFDNGVWKEAKTNCTVAIDGNLGSGLHHLEAICGTDTLKKDIVVFTLQDKKPAIVTHDWFYVSAKQFPSDGTPVYVQVGSSDIGNRVYYTILSGNKVLESGSKTFNNNVFTRSLKYEKTYGDGITIALAWVAGGKLYEHNVQISRPVPDTRLRTEWKTFRNKLVPGQKETWVLRILSPVGKRTKAQLMASLYDKSLNALYHHSWHMDNSFHFSLPYSVWIGPSTYTSYLSGSQNISNNKVEDLSFTHFDYSLFRNIRPFAQVLRLDSEIMPISKAMGAKKVMTRGINSLAVNEAKTSENRDYGTLESQELDIKNAGNGIRENLTETAFFYPALTTDSSSCVNISFTLPESVTTWRFMGLAHDASMNNALIDAEAIASKTIMVQPNMPRFLREGDKGQISTLVLNTSNKDVAGKVKLQIVDPETEKIVFEKEQAYSILANGSTSANFDVDASEILHLSNGKTLLAARIVAEGDGFSDGEQQWLPLLPDREYVINTIPFYQNHKGDKEIDLSHLFPNDSKDRKLTLEYTANPLWLVLQSMPTLANPNDKDAASLSAAIFANVLGKKILSSSPLIAKTMALWKHESGMDNSLASNLAKDSELKTMVLDETPWVADADNEAERKQQLAEYLDENTLAYRTSDFTSKLKALQNSDGSFSWWPGMAGSSLMTANVVETLTRLNYLSQASTDGIDDIINKGFKYLDGKMAEEVAEMKKLEKKGKKGLVPSELACHWLYSSALAKRIKTPDMNYIVNLLDKSSNDLTIYGKAGSAVILAQYGKQGHTKELIESIRQYSVYTDEMGRYFDTPRAHYSWCDYRIPTQTFAIEALRLVEPADTTTINQMLQWLLQEKRTTMWSTTINTVNAVYALLLGNDTMTLDHNLAEAQPVAFSIDGFQVHLPNATSGIGYIKTTVGHANAHKLKVKKLTDGTSWGAVYAQFTQNSSQVKATESGLSIKREVMGTSNMKLGDKIKVRLTVNAIRDFDFIQIQDKRAACLEPVNQISGNHGGYYVAPKDNITNYFFDHLRKGRHVIETEYYVNRKGDYISGIATIQCAYSPEFIGREQGKEFIVK